MLSSPPGFECRFRGVEEQTALCASPDIPRRPMTPTSAVQREAWRRSIRFLRSMTRMDGSGNPILTPIPWRMLATTMSESGQGLYRRTISLRYINWDPICSLRPLAGHSGPFRFELRRSCSVSFRGFVFYNMPIEMLLRPFPFTCPADIVLIDTSVLEGNQE